MADEYDAFIKAAQQAIKAQGAEHKQQFNNYLAEYNQTASTPVRDETDKYKVNTGAKGGFGTNYIAQSGVANGAGKGKPPRPASGKPKFDESWAEADNFLRTTDIPKDMDANVVKNTANYNDLLDQYRKGTVSAEEFKAETGMFPEEWDQQKGRYTTISENQRYAGWKRPDEDVNLLEPQMRDANMNPDGLRSDYNYAAADAAIQAQQKGMAQQKRYEDLMARYNSSKPVGEPYDEPLGPPAPTATQNYGNYYDGRSGNSVYTRYDEPVGPPAPSADPNSPISTYQQNQNAGVSGFTGNPQTNPEAAALMQEYNNRQAAHNSIDRRANYGKGNIDLNSRPILWNDDGSWSTVDSTIWGVDGKQVLLPTVIQQDGEWKHVDPNTALQHYFDTGEHLGKFDTVEEAGAYGEQLHNDQAQQYYPEMQRQREERRNSGRVYINNATGDMTPDARYRDIYDQLSRQGLTRDEILEWANGDAMEYMSPEEAMRFYIYAGNQRR